MTYKQFKEQLEREYLMRLMAETQGNIHKAASQAGVQRYYLYRLLKRFQITVSTYRIQKDTVE